MNTSCPICGRSLGDTNIDRHHLVPKSRGGRVQYYVHMICHRKIHATFTEKELEKKFHTWEEICAHPDIQKFIAWVQKKPSGFYDSTVTMKRIKR